MRLPNLRRALAQTHPGFFEQKGVNYPSVNVAPPPPIVPLICNKSWIAEPKRERGPRTRGIMDGAAPDGSPLGDMGDTHGDEGRI
jgi:hypothetical protein